MVCDAKDGAMFAAGLIDRPVLHHIRAFMATTLSCAILPYHNDNTNIGDQNDYAWSVFQTIERPNWSSVQDGYHTARAWLINENPM